MEEMERMRIATASRIGMLESMDYRGGGIRNDEERSRFGARIGELGRRVRERRTTPSELSMASGQTGGAVPSSLHEVLGSTGSLSSSFPCVNAQTHEQEPEQQAINDKNVTALTNSRDAGIKAHHHDMNPLAGEVD